MHFLLVGPGALGCLMSAVVTKGVAVTGDRLTLLDHNPERAEYLNRHGIVYQLGDTCTTVSVRATSRLDNLGGVDIVLLCVKSYDVAASLTFCRPLLTDKTLVIFLQNGISHLSISDHLGCATAAFGTTTEGATLLSRGHARHAGSGLTSLGFLAPADDHRTLLLERAAKVLKAGGLAVHATDKVLSKIWAKLFINVGINALTATLDCKNGQLLTLPGIDARMQAAVAEAILVARAEGIEIIDDPYQSTRIVCSKTAENISSMLQDVRNRRRTEIDAINGVIVAKGLSYNIKTPENSLLCHQVKELETGYREIVRP